MTAQPFIKFYTVDWLGDPKLRLCSLAARGLWADLICIANEGAPYGHVLINGESPSVEQIARLVGAAPDECERLLNELEGNRVFSRTRAGIIYSRRMVKDAKKAENARKIGAKGGNPKLRNKKTNPAQDNPRLSEGLSEVGTTQVKPHSHSHSQIPEKTTTTNEAALALKMLYRSIEERVFGAQRRQMPAGSDDRVAREWLRDGITARLVEEVVPGILERFKATNDGQPPGSMGYCTKALLDAKPKPNSGHKPHWAENPSRESLEMAIKLAKAKVAGGMHGGDWKQCFEFDNRDWIEHAKREGLL